METGKMSADYHLYKRQLDEAKETIKKLEADLAGYILTHKADSEHITHLEEKARQSKKIVMSNARRLARKKSVLNWVLYMEIFGTGSNTAQRACQDLGIDPDATTI